MRTFIIYMLLFCGFITASTATGPKLPDYIISVKPFLIFDGEYKVSFEKALNNPQHWVGIGISGFYLPDKNERTWKTRNTIDCNRLLSLKGYGLDASYKYYLNRNKMYLGSDLFYGNYNTKYNDWYLISFTENGLIFYEEKYGKVNKKYDKLAANAYFGIGTPITSKVFIDSYIGIGYSHSLNSNHNRMFDEIFGFGYTGFYPVFGIRVGMTFGR